MSSQNVNVLFVLEVAPAVRAFMLGKPPYKLLSGLLIQFVHFEGLMHEFVLRGLKYFSCSQDYFINLMIRMNA